MLTSEFDYYLPKELIAQTPAEPRDTSRLMVVDKNNKKIEHKVFKNIANYLKAGDLLVWNNSKVFKARLFGQVLLNESAANLKRNIFSSDVILNIPKIEVFLVRPMENFGVWRVLAKPGRKLRLGMKVVFAEDFVGEVLFKETDGTILMQFNEDDFSVRAKANKYGQVPVPPYIHSSQSIANNSQLLKDYQTVYAKNEGSVAAPTAGFHFTPELIAKLKLQGIEFAEVTLHVGLGTFLPVKSARVEDHKMHSEWVEITDKNAHLISNTKKEGKRVVAVGTTTVRVLEGVYKKQQVGAIGHRPSSMVGPYSGDINIFITPGFEFKIVDALITNFHLPKSTLLMLAAAFIGDREYTLHCYREATKERYRFYSFGDAMLIK